MRGAWSGVSQPDPSQPIPAVQQQRCETAIDHQGDACLIETSTSERQLNGGILPLPKLGGNGAQTCAKAPNRQITPSRTSHR